MKKLLLALTVLLGVGAAANAKDYTIDPFKSSDWSTEKYTDSENKQKDMATGTYTVDGKTFTVVAKQEKSSTAVTNALQANMFRWYQSYQLTVTPPAGELISKIVILDSNMKTSTFTVAGEAESDIKVVKAADNKTQTITWEAANPVAEFEAVALAQIRINSMTITTVDASSSKKPAGLSFGETTSFTVNFGDAFTAPTLTKATTAAVTYASSNADVATVDAATGAVTIVGAGTTKVTATAAENDDFYEGVAEYSIKVVKLTAVALAKEVKDGKYAFYMPGHGVATPFTGAYGYFYAEEVTVADDAFSTDEANLFTFAKEATGWTIKNAAGKFIGMDASHKSFNAYDAADAEGANCYWTITMTDEGAKIENTGRAGFYMYCCEFGGKWEITTTDEALAEGEMLPVLYSVEAAGIADVAVDADAAVEYFNLQGVRMQGDMAPGLYIRRQGNKATKVLVK
ncbi:MAG: Ig-like domain-containing protein [Bacteroides sp.]|nr:Ig-like domain-containing protein [Bacteroides sp.]MCM1094841.1 Ig-like domain-containing protein [Terasakiella sp.]